MNNPAILGGSVAPKTSDSSDQKEVPERLKVLRESMGWSMSELARRFGVGPGTVSRWESGDAKMSGPSLKLLEMYEKKASKFEDG